MVAAQIVAGGRACQVEAWTCLWVNFPIGTTAADPSVAGDHAEQLVTAMLNKVKV